MDKLAILDRIKEMVGRYPKPRPIGIDSLALNLKVHEIDLKAILETMEKEGLVKLHEAPSSSRRRKRSGLVEYIN